MNARSTLRLSFMTRAIPATEAATASAASSNSSSDASAAALASDIDSIKRACTERSRLSLLPKRS